MDIFGKRGFTLLTVKKKEEAKKYYGLLEK